MTSDLETQVYLIAYPLRNHKIFDGTLSAKNRGSMINYYMHQAEEQGFTSFNSYKTCQKIIKYIKDNHSLALISNDDMIRVLAENIASNENI